MFFPTSQTILFTCKMDFRSNFRSPILDSCYNAVEYRGIAYTRGPLPTILYLVSFWPPKLAWGKCLKLDVKEYSLKDIQTTVPSRVFGRWIYYVLRASSEHDRCRCQLVNARILVTTTMPLRVLAHFRVKGHCLKELATREQICSNYLIRLWRDADASVPSPSTEVAGPTRTEVTFIIGLVVFQLQRNS